MANSRDEKGSPRPWGIHLLVLLGVISVIFLGLLAARIFLFAEGWTTLGLFLGAYALVRLVATVGLWLRRRWGRALQLFVAILELFWFPVGTLLSVLTLGYLGDPWVHRHFNPATLDSYPPGREPGSPPGSWFRGAFWLTTSVVLVLLATSSVLLWTKELTPLWQARQLGAGERPEVCLEAEGVDEGWTVLFFYPLSTLDGVDASEGVRLAVNDEITVDGDGALEIVLEAGDDANEGAGAVRLFSVSDFAPRLNGPLVFEARVKTSEFRGQSLFYLRWDDPEKSEVSEVSPPESSRDWHWRQLVYVPATGEVVQDLHLDFAAWGEGTIWIDRVRVFSGPAWEGSGWEGAPPYPREGQARVGVDWVYQVVRGGDFDQGEALANALLPGVGASIPERLQRCVTELHLKQEQRRHLRRPLTQEARIWFQRNPVGEVLFDRMAVSTPWGEVTHGFYLPEYLDALVAAGPTEELAYLYGEELIEPLLAHGDALLDQNLPDWHREYFDESPIEPGEDMEFGRRMSARIWEVDFVSTVSALLERERKGEVELTPSQKDRMRSLLEAHLERLTSRELLTGSRYGTLFRVLTALESTQLRDRLPDLMNRRIATRGSLASQLNELDQVAELRVEGGAAVIQHFLDAEMESEAIRNYLEQLLAIHAGQVDVGASWGMEARADGRDREPVPFDHG